MPNTAQANTSWKISSRGWTKVFLTLAAGSILLYAVFEPLNSLALQAAYAGYDDNSAFGESQAEYAYHFHRWVTFLFLTLSCYAVPGFLISLMTNLIWSKEAVRA